MTHVLLRHAQRAAYRTAISAAQILLLMLLRTVMFAHSYSKDSYERANVNNML